ncbi:MAG: helix-turn-helix domain-containing protein [Sphingobacteriia bacterium]|nr:helix-turn-helix domain-containing protein [Sphingobacteriia bacterium]
MKTLIQKIHIEEQFSFACRTYKTPHFETSWHKHEECELILITEGHGTALIGDYVGNYNSGDVFFLTSNLPHWFRKSHHKMIGSALVIHFTNHFLGEPFLQLPEVKSIETLLSGEQGLLLNTHSRKKIAPLMKEIEKGNGLERIFKLLLCLQEISKRKSGSILTHGLHQNNKQEDNSIIKDIIDYTFNNYLKKITLQQLADLSGMSIPTFCRFFKKNIKKSYFDFLKEVRIGHACKLLHTTEQSVLDVCYNSGYNSWAHFSKQFKEVKKITPSLYRKQYELIKE